MTPQSLYAWFAASVEAYPEATAIEVRGRALSYRHLHDVVEELAALIASRPGGPYRRIAVPSDRGAIGYVAYLAVQRLGATVVPVNPDFPSQRNAAIFAAAEVDLLVVDTDGIAFSQIPHGITAVAVSMDELERGSADRGVLPAYHSSEDDVAYILFTSGSTGTPKGVPIEHRNLNRYLDFHIRRFQVGPGCRLSQVFDLTFDLSVFDMFVGWGAGATVVVADRIDLLSPADYIREKRLTHWFSVPSVVSLAGEDGSLRPASLPSLRWSIFCGERLTYRQAGAWAAAAPGSSIDNLYGPTELTISCTAYRLPANRDEWPRTHNDTVPIGPVLPWLEALIVDERGDEGDVGELCVRGPQRFAGYLDPVENQHRFFEPALADTRGHSGPLTDDHYYRTGDVVRVEPAGIVHVGRVDHQIKNRGFRIEPGDIEAVLNRHPSINEAIVVTPHDGSEPELLAAYTGDPVAVNELMQYTHQHLPAYMVPVGFVRLESLPRTSNGKVDRRSITKTVQSVWRV
ncbi:amino acid adenylation domain-containing protein [Krasilnikovia cinnamomea]|uniref:Amino acid adenylation domain-containing protein n=1 Tax=Krasilnikovia cinnamomea TaxID=349313 RepID=A0A4Q7ZR43_9ACTN|nr:amino acid adenylation domain-containing protein [Krasilnikovia cinnamomea]RZU53274.1 amino acid adenylation domain-containing protein [Krasilnikovia cinnamomea]